MMASSPICLLSKASKTKSWLWHRRLSHLNFGAINHLARHGLVRGLPKLKFEKDHLCSACALGKSTKKPHKPKSEDTNQEKLYLLHMDLCGPMRVTSVNGKKTDNGTEFVNQTLREYYEKVGISHETSVARSPQQNGVVERQNHTLIEAARTMLIYAKAPLFLWAKAVATACYTQNRSMIRLRHGKTPYELLHNKPPDLSYLHVFGALCYPTNDSENLGKLQQEGVIVAPEPAVSTSTPSLTTVDQDAPSPSNSITTPKTPPPVIPNDVEEDNHDIEVTHMGNDPYFGIQIPEVSSNQPSSSDTIHTIVHPDHQISEHNSKWTKDHPLENIIGELARPVSTQLQLHEKALFCYYDAFLTAVEPKTYKDALIKACWIENSMQEELNMLNDLSMGARTPTMKKYGDYFEKDLQSETRRMGGYFKDKALISRTWLEEVISPRAWYDMLSSFLISQDFSKGSVDPTLFIRREGKELLLWDIPMVEKSKRMRIKKGKAVAVLNLLGALFQSHGRRDISSLARKDQIDKLLERKKVNEELRKVRWWEIVEGGHLTATKVPYGSFIDLFSSLVNLMEILLDPTSHKDYVGYELTIDDEFLNALTLSMCHKTTLASDTLIDFQIDFSISIERFYTLAGNPVKEILLKLNLPDHRILKDGGEGDVKKSLEYVVYSVSHAKMLWIIVRGDESLILWEGYGVLRDLLGAQILYTVLLTLAQA
ncbi:retrovirus-related pol polyprotein from transposon TNT 1-94 [Tanacetum coccineum]